MRKSSMILVGIGIIVVVGVLGYPKYQSWNIQQKAKAAITAKLIDPTSVLFSDFSELKTVKWIKIKEKEHYLGTSFISVKVNAKNMLGGYTGAKEWTVFFTDDEVSIGLNVVGQTDELYGLLIKEVNENMTSEMCGFAHFAAQRLAAIGITSYLEKTQECLDNKTR